MLVLTKDEEKNLPRCLESIRWVDQVVVVDSFSRDATPDIARAHGAELVRHPFEGYPEQRNWALETTRWRNEWILILDADEAVTAELRAEIEALLEDGPAAEGYYVNRRVFFLGRWIRHCGWYPNWNLRLFRRGRARYGRRPVNEHLEIDGPLGYLHGELIHDNRKGLTAFLEKHNRYASLEAQARLRDDRRRGLWASLPELASPATRRRTLKRELWPLVPAKPLAFFFYSYVLQQGFLDGPVGLAFCLLMSAHELNVGLKMRELQAASAATSKRGGLRAA